MPRDRLLISAFAGHPARADTEPVIVGVPRDFYPEYAIGPDDRPEGFGVDVMNAVAKRAGLSVTYRVFATWSETLAALERGDIDAAASRETLQRSPSRPHPLSGNLAALARVPHVDLPGKRHPTATLSGLPRG